MTPTAPSDFSCHPTRGISSPGAVGVTSDPDAAFGDLLSELVDLPEWWYLAACHRCGAEDLSEPFREDEIGRDDWAIGHAETTGHLVHLSAVLADGQDFPRLATGHTGALLRCFPTEGWRWLCPTDECAQTPRTRLPKWNGPYPTGQAALASWRAHAKRVTR